MDDEEDGPAALHAIFSRCPEQVDLERQIMTHAKILIHLVCRMALEQGLNEEGIRTLYRAWSDMAAKQLGHPRSDVRRLFH